jgi:hypothetical protein
MNRWPRTLRVIRRSYIYFYCVLSPSSFILLLRIVHMELMNKSTVVYDEIYNLYLFVIVDFSFVLYVITRLHDADFLQAKKKAKACL